jgi:uncharacterized protein DUF6355
MKKALLAAVLVASGSALGTLSAIPASAAPAEGIVAAPMIPCGFFKDGDVAFYQNCSGFNAGIRIVHRDGSITTDCVLSYAGHRIGYSWDITTAYTYRTC